MFSTKITQFSEKNNMTILVYPWIEIKHIKINLIFLNKNP